MAILGNLMILLTVGTGVIVLQIFLSRARSRWPGLILPAVCLSYSLVMAFSYVAYQGEAWYETAARLAGIFFMTNIPTFVLLAIYAVCRTAAQRKQKKQMEKMGLHDL